MQTRGFTLHDNSNRLLKLHSSAISCMDVALVGENLAIGHVRGTTCHVTETAAHLQVSRPTYRLSTLWTVTRRGQTSEVKPLFDFLHHKTPKLNFCDFCSV